MEKPLAVHRNSQHVFLEDEDIKPAQTYDITEDVATNSSLVANKPPAVLPEPV